MPTKIEYVDETINPWGWGCYGPGGSAENPKVCGYCYAKILANRKLRKCSLCQQFVPHWHPEQLEKPLHWKKPRHIFVASMSDPFGSWVNNRDLFAVLDMTMYCPQHTFYLLTKQPENIPKKLSNWNPLLNVWLGATVTDFKSAEHAQQHMADVVHAGWHTFVSIEPFLNAVPSCSLWWPEWIIIGGLSRQGLPSKQPKKEWVEGVLEAAERWKRPVFMKKNLFWELHREEWSLVE